MISADDVKASVKQEIKEFEAVSYTFLWEVPTRLEIHCNNGRMFLLNGQYLLKVLKVVCWWSL